MRLSLLFCFLFGTVNAVASEEPGEAIRLYEYGKFQQAADFLSEKIKSAPTDARLHFWLGKSCLKLQRWDDAIREIEMAVQLDAKSSMYHLWLGRAYGQKASRIIFFMAFNWARRVVKEFQAAQLLAPDDIDVSFDLLEYYISSPAVVGGGRDKANAEAKAIARISPNLGYAARAMIFQKQKMWDQARAELEQAIKAYPSQAGRYEDLADYLFQRQDYGGAESNARKALAASPLLPKSKLILAASLVKLGNALSEAERILKEISVGPLKDDGPAFEEVHYWLGEVYLKQGKRENAIQAFETSLRFNPEFDMAKNAILQARRGG